MAVTPVGAPGRVLGVTVALGSDAADVPTPLLAVTVNVYEVPLVSPVRFAIVSPVVVTVLPPGVAVTVYPVTADPPSPTGSVHDSAADALPASASTPVGGLGTVLGVTAALGSDAADVPTPLLAVTLNVYEVPLVSPVTVALVSPVVVTVFPPGVAVTV